jgi:uncharacterized membrane protein
MELYHDKFLELNSHLRIFAFATLAILTFALTFAVVPFMEWRMHFFQLGIFLAAFLFGPFAGAAVGAISGSYTGLFVLSNPWIIGGNAILGFSAAYLYTRTTPFKAAMGAFAIQLPYLFLTDILFVGMPLAIVTMIALTLLVTNLLCAFMAASMLPQLRLLLARS